MRNFANIFTSGLGLILLAAAFVMAQVAHEWDLLSVIPPGGTVPDTGPNNLLALYQSAFTAWVTVVLLVPVFVLVWFRNASTSAWRWWLAFWGVSWLTYIVHLCVSAFGFFGGDFDWMTRSSRVSAFWPSMVLALWWLMDVALAWRARIEGGWVKMQRVFVHFATFVLFFGGSTIKGELLTIKGLGLVMAAGMIIGGAVAFRRRKGTL